jgi:predicted ATPase
MAFPGATIISCDSGRLEPVAYEDLEHVYITRGFLENRKLYLRELGFS